MRKQFTLSSPRSQLAAELRRRIAAGEFAGRMPGLRRLMAGFGASRTVVEGALAELVKTGDLRSRGASRAMEPVMRRVAKDLAGTLLVFDRPPEMRGGVNRETFLALEAVLPAPVTRLSLDSHDTTVEKTVARILESSCRRIVVLDHRGEVADRLAEAGRIVVDAGMAGVPRLVPRVLVSHEALVRGAVRKAFEAGHRRVSFVLWRRKPEVEAAMRGWVADEYAKSGYEYSPGFDTPVPEDRTPAALHACLRSLLRHTPPTALIVSDFPQWLGTVMVLAEAGLRVPRDLSLVSLASAPEWETAIPAQAHFTHPVAAYANAVRAALDAASRGVKPASVTLAPTWVPGGSLAGPARR